MRCLVTGGTGCLGAALVPRLLASGCAVRVLALDGPVPLGVELVRGSINDESAVERACEGAQTVVHLAAAVHGGPGGGDDPEVCNRVNVEGTRTLIAAASKAGTVRIVFASTVGIYGRSTGIIDELSKPAPSTPYARSKLIAEDLLRESAIPAVILRFPLVYGPNDRGNMHRLIAAISRRRFFLVAGGQNRRAMISAYNAAEAIVLAGLDGRADGHTLLVSDLQAYALRDVVSQISRAIGQDWTPPNLPRALGKGAAFGGTLVQRLLGIDSPLNLESYQKLFESQEIRSQAAALVLGYKGADALDEGIREEVRWMIEMRMLRPLASARLGTAA